MSITNTILSQHPYLEKDSILIGYRGSIAHGMYIPNTDPNSIDDKDAMAIVIPCIDHYFGLNEFGSKGTKEINPSPTNEWDIVTYEFLKFVDLLIKNNPNVLSMLWLDEDMFLKKTKEGQILVDNRDLFVSKRVYPSFIGYAYGQLKRMTHFKCEGYMGEKRKALVDKFGFDTKNGAHGIRILRMGIEFLKDQTFHVNRKGIDADELLSIKKGEWSLEQIQAEADKLIKLAEIEKNKSSLPDEPNLNEINELCITILKGRFGL
jgi:predicted nucleotidyltransferase